VHPAASTRSIPFQSYFRDLAAGFDQQMFFWGRDAIHPDGNLFVRSGFQKRASTGLQGTSCYSLPWQGGIIELHGSHAGWIGEGGGFLFVRPLKRCVRWLDTSPPVPGVWPQEKFNTTDSAGLHALAIPFLDWWIAHEREVARLAGPRFRDNCYRQYRKLPKTRPWLTPATAIRWITTFRDAPESLTRARKFASSLS
jgi:hypothetical protein